MAITMAIARSALLGARGRAAARRSVAGTSSSAMAVSVTR
jgi:hypothetical protein